MKRAFAIAVLLGCFPILAAQETPTSPKPVISITIKVLNGKTGKPVWRESPNIWVDQEGSINPYTGLLGNAKIKVSGDAKELRITPNFGHECRWAEDTNTGMKLSYSVVEILRNGIVSENLCGAVRVAPIQGVLVFYELPSTWRELWYY